jgi:hypothetical protein
MALFGLSDITISQEKKTRGPLAPLFTDEYGTSNTFRYPLDIGNYDKAHYMVIHIFQQNKSVIKGIERNNNLPTGIDIQTKMNNLAATTAQNFKQQFSSVINNKIDGAFNSINNAVGGRLNFFKASGPSFDSAAKAQSTSNKSYIDSVANIQNESLFKNQTTRTKDSIVLYMPDTVQFSSTQGYENLDLGGLAGQAGKIGASILKGEEVNVGGAVVAAAVNAGIKKLGELSNSGDAAKAAAFLATGGIVNPQLELLYTAPNFRSFNYEFMFYPRSEQEALEVQNIIERLRFHQAPELDKSTANVLLIPPSEFEIMFFYNGRKNPNIPNMTRCVLESIDVNYAPNGWSAYEMPGESSPAIGRTGMPTAIQLTLGFKETQFLTKRDFRTFASDNKK